eukprot:scaffold174_cov98-Cylindrotheca_fusiformis.AAC.9
MGILLNTTSRKRRMLVQQNDNACMMRTVRLRDKSNISGLFSFESNMSIVVYPPTNKMTFSTDRRPSHRQGNPFCQVEAFRNTHTHSNLLNIPRDKWIASYLESVRQTVSQLIYSFLASS